LILGIHPFYDDYYCFHDYKYQPIGILSVLATLRAAGYEVSLFVLSALAKKEREATSQGTKRLIGMGKMNLVKGFQAAFIFTQYKLENSRRRGGC